MIKDDVTKALGILGFIPEEIEGYGQRIEYEGLNMLISDEDEEAKCVNMLVPCLFTLSEENRHMVYDALIQLCCKMKYVQPIIMFKNQIWLNYQHFVGDNDVTPELLEHMIHVLNLATINFLKIINEDDYGL